MLASGAGRAATRGAGPVIELECGITVYPARGEQGRWRAVWHENGQRQQCEAASEEKLAAKLAKVTERLEADAPNMTLRGADLIAFYLSADRLPVQRQWSRKHAHTQLRRHGDRDELMAVTAAYSGLRWGELAALTIGQVDPAGRVISVDRRWSRSLGTCMSSRRRTASTAGRSTRSARPPGTRWPSGSPPASSRPGPSKPPAPTPSGWSSRPRRASTGGPPTSTATSCSPRRAAGWRDAARNGRWTWHSLRHVFCTTALFTWKLEATDVSRMAGHSNYRITLDMYIGTTAGVLDRARTATQ